VRSDRTSFHPAESSSHRIALAGNDTAIAVMALTRNFLHAGQALHSSREGSSSLQLLNGQLGVLESVTHCVQQGWPVLLAGGQGTGGSMCSPLIVENWFVSKHPGFRQDLCCS